MIGSVCLKAPPRRERKALPARMAGLCAHALAVDF